MVIEADRSPPLLSTFTDILVKVPVEHETNPLDTIDFFDAIGPRAVKYIDAYYGKYAPSKKTDVEYLSRQLEAKVLAKLSLDQMCKIRHASLTTLHPTVEKKFEDEPRFRIIEKIRSSMWRWGMNRAGWNEVVDCYDGIRAFSLDNPHFEVRLDYTTGWNKQGYAEYSDTFLDGALAFLVFYRGQHVMTLGFSLLADYRLLIQQIQMKSPRGNRFLYRLPRNYIEYVVGCFATAFPHHQLYIVDGETVARKSEKAYERGVEKATAVIAENRAIIERFPGREDLSYYRHAIERKQEDLDYCTERLAHIRPEIARLKALYRDTGRFRQGEVLEMNGLRHYALS